jgi:uncharacterized membrane protein YoaK (UPF0700 family)
MGGHFGLFGEFGHEPELRQDYLLLALLCAASGLQNAVVSSASGSAVRTTHLTGLTTDLGTGLVRAFSNRRLHESEMRAARLRFGTIVSFTGGSFAGAASYLHLHYLGFLGPALIATYFAWKASRADALYIFGG